MSGSKKGRKLRPYRQGAHCTTLHVLMLTPEQRAEDAFENLPSTSELLNMSVLDHTTDTPESGSS